MEALQAWNLLISFLYSLLGAHCYLQVTAAPTADHNTEPLSPIILLPAPSAGISYEALHYPVPADQYQLIPLVINTGKIPYVNHAIQAPIQYFVPNSDNLRMSSYDPVQQRSDSTEHDPTTYSSSPTIKSQPADKHYPPTTIYSETHVENQPNSRYSYGYEIIDGDVGEERELRDNDGYRLLEPERTKRIQYTTDRQHHHRGTKSHPVDSKPRRTDRKGDQNLSKALKPIIVQPNTTTELKKYYQNPTNLKTSTNEIKRQNPSNSTT